MKFAYSKSGLLALAAGWYVCVLIRVLDLGTRPRVFDGRMTKSRDVMMTWEIHGAGKTAAGNLPLVSQIYTATLHPKSKLLKVLQGWNGAPFTDDELATFDISKWLGREANLQLDVKGKFNVVLAAAPAERVSNREIVANDLILFDLAAPDMRVFSELSPKVQAMIAESEEWMRYQGGACTNAEGHSSELAECIGDDISEQLASEIEHA